MTTTLTPASGQTLNQLLAQFGSDIVRHGESLPDRRFLDWSGEPGARPLALLLPRNTTEVAGMLALCQQAGQPVVVQGGLTGLAGAANLQAHDMALSLERMTAITVDPIGGTLTAEAGATLQSIQEAAEAAGFWFPLDLGARGSCTLGGNLGTNAGGNRVIRYGMARDQVLDLEAVLADGRVIGGQRAMLKNNTGYDLRHLLIGSEGTLGIITRAVLRLRAHPSAVATAWCGLPDYDAVTRLLHRAQARLANGVSAFEVMWPGYYRFVLNNVSGLRAPLQGEHSFHVLLESLGSDSRRHQAEFESFLGDMLEDGTLDDAAVAQSEQDARQFWDMRDAPANFPVMMPRLIAFDVSFALGDIATAAQDCANMLDREWPGSTLLVYGHLGDGNLHVIINVPDPDEARTRAVENAVYDLVERWHGSVSAEHGIGIKKRNVLGRSRSADELAVMAAIRQALDPAGILNPGKLF